MNAAEKVATLEALLAKVKRNAQAPRPAPILAQVISKASAAASAPVAAASGPFIPAPSPSHSSREVRDSEVDFNFESPPLRPASRGLDAGPKPPLVVDDVSPRPPVAAVDATPKPPIAAAEATPRPPFVTVDATPKPSAVAADGSPKPAAVAAKLEPSKQVQGSPSARPDGLRGFPTARAASVEPSKPIAPVEDQFSDLDDPADEQTIARNVSDLDFSDEATVTRAAYSETLARTLLDPEEGDAPQAPPARPLGPSSRVAISPELRGAAPKPTKLSELTSTVVMAASKPATAQPQPNPAFAESAAAKAATPPAPQAQMRLSEPFGDAAPPVAQPQSPGPRRGPKATLMGVGIADMEALQRQLDRKDEITTHGSEIAAPSDSFAMIEPRDSELIILSRTGETTDPAPTLESAPATEMLPHLPEQDGSLSEGSRAFSREQPRPIETPLASTLASEGETQRMVHPEPAVIVSRPPAVADNPWARDAAAKTQAPPKKSSSSGLGWMFFGATFLLVGAGVFIYLRHNGLEDLFNPKPAPLGSTVAVAPKSPDTAGAKTPVPPVATVAPPSTAPVAPTATTAPTASVSAATTAGAAPVQAVDAGAPAATSAPPAGTAPAAAGDLSTLLASEGFLIVESSVDAGVFSNGKFVGETNQTLKIPCGPRYVRLATPSDPPKPSPGWITSGTSVIVACKASTTAKIEPGAVAATPAPQNPVYP